MQRVDIKIGFQCNNRCKFCVQGSKRDYLPAKTEKEVERSLKEAYGQGKNEVVFKCRGGSRQIAKMVFGSYQAADPLTKYE